MPSSQSLRLMKPQFSLTNALKTGRKKCREIKQNTHGHSALGFIYTGHPHCLLTSIHEHVLRHIESVMKDVVECLSIQTLVFWGPGTFAQVAVEEVEKIPNLLL